MHKHSHRYGAWMGIVMVLALVVVFYPTLQGWVGETDAPSPGELPIWTDTQKETSPGFIEGPVILFSGSLSQDELRFIYDFGRGVVGDTEDQNGEPLTFCAWLTSLGDFRRKVLACWDLKEGVEPMVGDPSLLDLEEVNRPRTLPGRPRTLPGS